jgi:3-oxoacyl-[acyl-carrier protein] reductase
MLSNKVAIVTGCARGMGLAITNLFLKNGATVYGVDLVSAEINDDKFIPCAFDITDEKNIKDFVLKIKKEQNRIDILVNNAGIMIDSVIPMVTNEQIHKTFEVNVFAIMHFIQYVSRLMTRQKFGSIINFASIMGISGNANQMVYAASKGAVIALTKSVAKELSPSNVRCNAIAPGTISTDLLKNVPDEKLEMFKSRIAMGRLGTPEEVAQAVLFLASDNSSYISGQVLGVDGMQIN